MWPAWGETPRAGRRRDRGLSAYSCALHQNADICSAQAHVCFSNRPFGVKHFQTIHHDSVDVAHGLVLLFGIGTKGPSIMGFENETEQSFGRPCRQADGRSNQTYELTSFIVPRGTPFHRSVELECSPIALGAECPSPAIHNIAGRLLQLWAKSDISIHELNIREGRTADIASHSRCLIRAGDER